MLVFIYILLNTHMHINTHIFRNKTIPKMANIRGTVYEARDFGTQDSITQFWETDSITNLRIY